MAYSFFVDEIVQWHYRDVQQFVLLTLGQIQLYLLYVVSISIAEISKILLLFILNQFIASPFKDTESGTVLL